MPNLELFPGWAFCIFRSFPYYKSLELWEYRWICGIIVRLMGVIVGIVGVIVKIVGNRWIYEKQYRKHTELSRVLCFVISRFHHKCCDTVFSGIGAIEHALDRMGIQHEIVFACDNGDVGILNKEVAFHIDEVGTELKHL